MFVVPYGRDFLWNLAADECTGSTLRNHDYEQQMPAHTLLFPLKYRG